MKHTVCTILVLLLFVGVGYSQSLTDPSAAMQVSSTTQGFLPPQLTQAQRDAIPSPAAGLVVYNTTTNKLNNYDGTQWAVAGTQTPTFLIDDDGDTQVQVEETGDEDKIRFDTAGTERMIIDDSGNVGIGTNSPTQRLHIDGSMRVEDHLYDSNNQSGTLNEVLTATATGTDWVDINDISSGAAHYFEARTKSEQALAALTHTKMTGWTEVRDDNNAFNGTDFTAPSTGIYHLKASIYGHHNVSASYRMAFYVNGSFNTRIDEKDTSPFTTLTGSAIINLNAGDVVDLRVFTNTAVTSSVFNNNAQISYFIGYKVAGGVDNLGNHTATQDIKLGTGFGLTDTDGDTQVQVEETGGENKIRFDTAGTERMIIDDSGNVGIGTVSPSNSLNVVSNQEGTGSGNQFYQLGIGKSGLGEVQIGTHNSLPAISGQGTGTRHSLLLNPENNGSVGIGTLTPSSTLSINSTKDIAQADPNGNPAAFSIHDTSAGFTLRMDTNEIQASNAAGVGNNININPFGGDLNVGTLSETTKRLHFDSSNGRLGIGTINPSDKLHIVSPHSQLRLTDSDDSKFIQMSYSGGGLAFRPNSTTAVPTLYVGDNGNVGIGTINPAVPLEVRYGSGEGLIISKTNDWPSMTFKENSGDEWSLGARGNYFSLNFTPNSGTSSNLFSIKEGGSVGIGTTNPNESVHIQSSNSGGDVAIRIQNSANTSGDTTSLFFTTTSNSGFESAYLQSTRNNNLIFGTNQAERMRINNLGNVGIGTTAPTERLHVVGNALKTSGGTAWKVPSDKRIKKDIKDYTKGLAEIVQIRPVSYQYNEKSTFKNESDHPMVGIIAQEIQKVLPSTVSEMKTEHFDDLLSYDSSELLYTLINAVKELNGKVQALSTENDALKAENKEAENQLADVIKRLEKLEQQ